MTGEVHNEGEVYLGTRHYPIVGKVRRQLVSRFPAKVDIGDFSYGNELFKSNWIISDQRGGIGVEEMDETKHANRCWWSTCDLDYKGHLIPQPLGVSLGAIGKVSPTGFTDPDTKWTNEANAYDGDLATYALTGVGTGAGAVWGSYLQLSIASMTIVGVAIKVGRENADITKIDIDYYDGAWNDIFEDTIPANMLNHPYVFAIADTGVTQIRVRFYNSTGVNYDAYIYEAYFIGTTTTISKFRACNFNSNLYFGVNDILCKLNTSNGAALIPVGIIFPANITDLISTIGTQMCVLLGDSNAFWYMSSAEALTQTDETGAYWGIHWDNKFFWIDSVGAQLSYASTLAATLVETNNGSLPESVAVNGLMIYHDTADDDIIYAGTRNKFWAHDFTNAKFIETKLDFADHPNACKGMVNWNGDAHISMGLHVKRYSVGGGVATVTPVGLDRDDGVPNEYNGEIIAFIKDSEQFYALVDSTQIGTSGTSWVAKYNGFGWQCLWLETATNKNMHGGIVSSVYARRLYFDSGNAIYYVPLQRTKIFPKKVSTYTYAAYGRHYTPWMDGGTSVFEKLALALKTYCLDLTANETAAISYRINKADTTIAGGWTLLIELDANDNNDVNTKLSTTGSTGDGKVFDSIQFRIVLGRGSTTTLAVDLQAIVLSFLKLLDLTWMFSFTVDCAGPKAKGTSKELEDALITAAESGILLEFTYRSDEGTAETHYVKITPMGGLTPTGKNHDAQYNVTVFKP